MYFTQVVPWKDAYGPLVRNYVIMSVDFVNDGEGPSNDLDRAIERGTFGAPEPV